MPDYPKYRNNVCSKSCIYLNYSNHKTQNYLYGN